MGTGVATSCVLTGVLGTTLLFSGRVVTLGKLVWVEVSDGDGIKHACNFQCVWSCTFPHSLSKIQRSLSDPCSTNHHNVLLLLSCLVFLLIES